MVIKNFLKRKSHLILCEWRILKYAKSVTFFLNNYPVALGQKFYWKKYREIVHET